jgi:hypothetical protein
MLGDTTVSKKLGNNLHWVGDLLSTKKLRVSPCDSPCPAGQLTVKIGKYSAAVRQPQ